MNATTHMMPVSSLSGQFGSELVHDVIKHCRCARHHEAPVAVQLQDRHGDTDGTRRALVLVGVR
jgi:hypothetical protein